MNSKIADELTSEIKKVRQLSLESEIKKQMDNDGIKEQALSSETVAKEVTAYITKLLQRHNWTGEEAGKVLIYDLIKNAGLKTSAEGVDKWKNILKVYSTKLKNFAETDQSVYMEYHTIHKWLLRAHALATAHQQSFAFNDLKISGVVKTIYSAEFISYRITHISRQQDPQLYSHLDTLSLDRFTTENKEQNIESIKSARKNLLKEFYFIRGYCKAIELIADYIKINALNILQIKINPFYGDMVEINNTIARIVLNISDYAPEDKITNKLNILNTVFEPVKPTWRISNNTTNIAQEQLRKKEVFVKDPLYFIELFTTQETYDDTRK